MIQPSVNGFLTKLSVKAMLKSKRLPKINIDKSIASVKTRLNLYHRAEITEQFVFGSYRRKTILPRFMDAKADVDYMVVFSNTSFQPQTYLDHLRRFVDKNYPKTLIKQDHPAIRLDLNHIRFELVPAIRKKNKLWIPAKSTAHANWIATDPNDFIIHLTKKNQQHKNHIRPLVRLVKYWNASNGYPYESFELEKAIVECDYSGGFFSHSPKNLRDYFYHFMKNLDDNNDAQWKNDVVNKAHQILKDCKWHEENNDDPRTAISELQRILPDVSVECQ